ncbi:replication protein A 70 kDa DNA-binding subunit C-like [Lotus japonicus]|uniref:replication protein A 70 kDa DNA-binding subunit C-like n=1 Tax=Lotus japonicus TaxID=34305 RepID=UPI0025897443|nr:replication protein A 70 kDa DNA-binding subunit C-like [Lotus japonicus]
MCERFVHGLSYELQRAVQSLGINRYQVLVEKTKGIEAIDNQREKYQGLNKSKQGSGGPTRANQGRNDKGENYSKKPYVRPQGKGTTSGSVNPSGGDAIALRPLPVSLEGVTCFKCNKKGHFFHHCPEDPSMCWNCNEPCHLARDCRKPEVEATMNIARGQGGQNQNQNVVCFKCGQAGHCAKACARRCYNCRKPGHSAKDCEEQNIEPTARGPGNLVQPLQEELRVQGSRLRRA